MSLIIVVVIGSAFQIDYVANSGQPTVFEIGSLLATYFRGVNPEELLGALECVFCCDNNLYCLFPSRLPWTGAAAALTTLDDLYK